MASPSSTTTLRQAEVLMALSLATDLGTGRPMEWALRSAMLSVRLSESLGLSEAELREAYHCALLLYIGCTSEIELALQLFGDDPAQAIASVDFVDQGDPHAMLTWLQQNIGVGRPPEEREQTLNNMGAIVAHYKLGHCEVAARLAERLGLEASTRHALGFMAEKWNGEGVPHGVQGEAIPRPMRLVLLVRDLEPHLNMYGVEAAVTVARARAGTIHDPEIAVKFCEQAAQLCATLEQDAQWENVLALEPAPKNYSSEEFDQAMLAVADFVDLSAPTFAGHSRRVASLAEAAAPIYGLSAAEAKLVWRAALAHDVGKVAVPLGLWSAARPLSQSEWERVRLHPYYTERILARPALLAQLGACGGIHHERLDGSGYFRQLRADDLPPAGRLLAAANFYQARVEARPHREAQLPEAVAVELRKEIRAGRLEDEAVRAVLQAAGHHITPVRRERVAGLSEREMDVLRLLARGYSNKQMAQQLGITEKTAGNHVVHIYEKIGCSTRSAATLFALQNNILDTPT